MHHARLTEVATPGQPAFDHAMTLLQHDGLSHTQSLGMLDNLINLQAFTMSATDLFMATAVIFLLLTGTVWLSTYKRAQSSRGGAAEAAAGAH